MKVLEIVYQMKKKMIVGDYHLYSISSLFILKVNIANTNEKKPNNIKLFRKYISLLNISILGDLNTTKQIINKYVYKPIFTKLKEIKSLKTSFR